MCNQCCHQLVYDLFSSKLYIDKIHFKYATKYVVIFVLVINFGAPCATSVAI